MRHKLIISRKSQICKFVSHNSDIITCNCKFTVCPAILTSDFSELCNINAQLCALASIYHTNLTSQNCELKMCSYLYSFTFFLNSNGRNKLNLTLYSLFMHTLQLDLLEYPQQFLMVSNWSKLVISQSKILQLINQVSFF